MPNSSAKLAGRRTLRRSWPGLFFTAAVVALIILTTEPARAATIHVAAGGNFQQALDTAQPGDTITLEAGATFVGPFTLPHKVGTGTDANWITIRTSAPDSSLPTAGQRITPAYASVLPKLVSPGSGHPAVQTEPRAHHYRFVGVEFRAVDSQALVFDLVKFGDSGANQDTTAEVPHHLALDRCYVHALPEQGLKRGILLNSAHTDILNSYVEGFKTIGQDAQAAGGWNGPGPFKLINNYFEGAGQNVIFGGADPSVPNLVPSDIEVRNNHFFKPPSWKNPLVPPVNGAASSLQSDPNSTLVPSTRYYYRVVAQFSGFNGAPATPDEGTEVFADPGANQAVRISWNAWSHGSYTPTRYFVLRTTQPPGGSRDWKWYLPPVGSLSFTDGGQTGTNEFAVEARWGVKNIFELKSARRVVIEGNVFENNWGHGQTGEAILFTVRNQDGAAPWSAIEDVLFTHNIVRHVGGAFTILGEDYNHPSQQTKRVTIRDNLFDDVNGTTWNGRGEFLLMTGGAVDIHIDHNTIFHTGSIMLLGPAPHTGFRFNNNVARHNEFGVFGDSVGSGTVALQTYTPGYEFRRNLIAEANPNAYPPDNYYPPDFDAQFVNRAGGDYRLAPTSCGSMASTTCNPKGGTDGRDVGADIAAVKAATAGAVSGTFGRRNVALSANGGVATASSSQQSGNFPATAVNNGDRRGLNWGAGGGWNDGTLNQYPDWVQVEFNGSKTIDEVNVFTLQDNFGNPAEPTEATTFSLYGVTSFQVQYWDDVSGWLTVPGGSVSGNNKVWRKFTFAPVTTTKVRVLVQLALDQSSRITEVEAWEKVRSNHALALNGAAATASSSHQSGNYPAAATINGDRRGLNWSAGGGWNDGTLNQYPDTLEINFPGERRVDEVSVFTVQDAFSSPAEPTEAMTFSLYGVTSFVVEYWDGSQWIAVPGGSVSGNNKVWRRVTFPEVTTTKIRVRVNAALDGYSRLTEVEAWGGI